MNVYPFKNFLKANELLIQVFIFIILNYIITKILYRSLDLPEVIYMGNSIFIKFLEHLTVPLSLFLLVPLVLYKVRWKDIIESHVIFIKYFVLFILTIWAWNIITLDLNLYFNQAYHFDRFILLGLFILAFRYPLFIIY